jgi:S-adenosylmethionine-diacylglycerol 3-amino-3-carboxypropyl transferase
VTATALDQSVIWYAACNEDAASEIAALQPAGQTILTITASGSRAFDLLLADAAAIVAIDQNPAQTALAELFAAAYRECDYAAFCGLTGLRDDPRRLDRLDALLPHVSEAARGFWRANRHIAAPGLLYCGRWEGFLRRFGGWAGSRRQALADRLLRCPDMATQRALWNADWDDWQWRLFLRALALRPVWRWGLREPGIAYVPADFDMTGYARARFDHAAHDLHLARLPFAWLLLNGGYTAGVLPPYLTEAGHDVIRARIDRLSLRTQSLQDAVMGAAPGSFDGASLSDYSSYCDVAEQRAVWHGLARALRPGGVVCERKFFNKSGMELPADHGFHRDAALEAQLDAADGAWFYTFVVARRVAG